MRTVGVYRYDELPTEKAKERAREWWIDLEIQDPAWQEDHFKSMRAAISAASETNDKRRLIRASEKAEFTGYCADCLLGDMIKEMGRIPSESEIVDYYNRQWDSEINDRLSDVEYIEEVMHMNEYEFLEDGTRY